MVHLLTEDSLRFCVSRALVDAGVNPSGLQVERPHPVLPAARVDLVARSGTGTAVIELKYPREPDEKNAAWTMVLGEVLRDFFRLARYPGNVDRVFVYLETTRLRRYMAGVARNYRLDLDVEDFVLALTDDLPLPATALQSIGSARVGHPVHAHRAVVIDINETLRLSVYEVHPIDASSTSSVPPVQSTAPSSASARDQQPETDGASSADGPNSEMAASTPRRTRDGARYEILQAIRAVLARSGDTSFTVAQVIAEMTRRDTGYPKSTISTMITAHMCRNAPDNAATTYDDLERIGRGIYRLASH